MTQALRERRIRNEIVHALRAILDENEKTRDSAIAVSLVFCIQYRKNVNVPRPCRVKSPFSLCMS